MPKKLKIGWQKYEDILEQQMSSPLLSMMMEKIQDSYTEEEDEEENVYAQEEILEQQNLMIPISKQLFEDMSMLTNFDCWMGHTNFDITNETKNILNKIEGVEIMRICSRYRFFVGIGKMFDFKNVRSLIEKALIK